MDNVKIIYFSAEWCGPCKQFKPLMEKLEEQGYPIYFEDVDADPVLAESHQVRSVPTIKIVKDDKVVETMVGVQDPAILTGKFQLYAPLDFSDEG
tara:strand:+ start:174 stop:458 length:285 start_codon:yes stop_codon:yes gene_type:complete